MTFSRGRSFALSRSVTWDERFHKFKNSSRNWWFVCKTYHELSIEVYSWNKRSISDDTLVVEGVWGQWSKREKGAGKLQGFFRQWLRQLLGQVGTTNMSIWSSMSSVLSIYWDSYNWMQPLNLSLQLLIMNFSNFPIFIMKLICVHDMSGCDKNNKLALY